MRVVILGTGTTAKIAIAILRKDFNFEIFGLTDHRSEVVGKRVSGVPVIGTHDVLDDLQRKGVEGAFIAIGYDNALRERYFYRAKRSGFALVTIVDPTAHVERDALLGRGTLVMAGSILCSGVRVGDNVIVESGSVIGPDTEIADNAFIGFGARVGGSCVIRRNAYLGIGCSIGPCVNIGKNVKVNPGAIVISELRDVLRDYA